MKRQIAILLVLLMLTALLAGCSGNTEDPAALALTETSAPTPAPTPEPAPAPTLEPAPERIGPSLSWAKAFRSNKLSDGAVYRNEIAFYVPDDAGGAEIVNVPKEEVLAFCAAQESLPRTRFYEQFMPESFQELYPVLDYAVAHNYSRACIPTTAFAGEDVVAASPYLHLTYRINDSVIGALSVASVDLEDGETLRFVLVTLPGMDSRGRMSEYRQSVAAASEIVAGIPEGSSEYEKALYLYSWLTENVRYDSDNYYDGRWTLLYDALVKHKTVCAGYAEALYVLYNLAGIECFTVEGYLNTPEGGGSHIWNVARIDGEYYQFDATWDEGFEPKDYYFFGVSEETLQSYYPRDVETLAREYCPPCTRDLPLPGGGSGALPEELQPGTVEDGVYAQPFFDLRLYVDESWNVYSREEIAVSYYGDRRAADLSVSDILKMGLPYSDLAMTRDDVTVQILLERSPVQTQNGEICDSAESYADSLFFSLPEILGEIGLKNAANGRSSTEICGRRYEVVFVTGRVGATRINQTFYCTEQNGIFLTVSVAISGEGTGEEILAQLLAEPNS